MENFVSNWSNGASLPESYVFPPEKRPGQQIFVLANSLPVIDLEFEAQEATKIINQISKATQEWGLFQVVKHGISEDLMDETMSVIKEFHAMAAEDKARECNRSCKIYSSSANYATEKVHFWRDALQHPCHPLQHYIQFWPQQPPSYRDVVASYIGQVTKLGHKILRLISEGLGLCPDYLSGELGEEPMLLVNHYPPCPNPSLTLGLSKHIDPSVITILLQGDVDGLQVFKDGEWIGVKPIPRAFLVNVGYLLQIISNGRLKGAQHRVVTNSNAARTTASFFIYPCDNSVIGPAKAVIDERNPRLYRPFRFKDFRDKYVASAADDKAIQEFLQHE
ncbi:hypothetical protein L6164_034431 [Bauhinia variegata]|uniref:Uncharacterized protein n=1 Tax=Bauhinia variegata TaxID=167791 RepID=A0ACB9KUS9_BAUVA|nr:hypothetical protein L6164_034431 [Bauhinia variegata]